MNNSSRLLKRQRLRRRRAAFTLIELMIIVAVIGLLMLAVFPKAAKLITKSKEGTTKGSLGSIRAALGIYYSDNEGVYPSDDLQCLINGGKYLGNIPKALAPGVHPPQTVVENVDSLGAGGLAAADSGRWCYWNRADVVVSGYDWGMTWLGCTHDDTRGNIFTSY